MTTKTQPSSSLWLLGLGAVAKLILFVFLGCFIFLLIAIVLMVFQPHEQVLQLVNQLLAYQLHLLHTLNTSYFVITQPEHKAVAIINTLREWFIQTNVRNGLSYLHEPETTNPFLKDFIKNAYPILKDYLRIFILIIKLSVVKIIQLILYLPLYGVLGFVGIVDGLVQRRLRQLRGMRESALIYHRARDGVVPTFILGFFIYLLLPTKINPETILVPFALLFAVSISITIRTFKKYL